MNCLIKLFNINLKEISEIYSKIINDIHLINNELISFYPIKKSYLINNDVYYDNDLSTIVKEIVVNEKGLYLIKLINLEYNYSYYLGATKKDNSLITIFSTLEKVKNIFSSSKIEKKIEELKNLSDNIYYIIDECIKCGVEILCSSDSVKKIIIDSESNSIKIDSYCYYIKEITLNDENDINILCTIKSDFSIYKDEYEYPKYVRDVNSITIDVLLSIIKMIKILVKNKFPEECL